MKTVAILASCLLLAGAAQAECVALEPQKSSSRVRIAVVLDGKPLAGVSVSIYQDYPSRFHFPDLTTDENGVVALPELPGGTYDVSAILHGVVSSSLSLGVTPGSDVSVFSIDLTEAVQRTEGLPVRDQIQAFEGTISDPSGAMIPGTDILVVKKGSHLHDVVLKAKVGSDGHFGGELAEGSYIAFFFSRGFRTVVVPLEKMKKGQSSLRIMLNPGSC